MRLVLMFVLIAFIALIPQMGFSEQAKTIDELVKMYDPAPCIECHKEINEIYTEWKNSKHANSIADPIVRRTWTTFITQGLDKEKGLSRKDLGVICLPCHVPQIRDASPELAEHIANLVVTSVQAPDKTKRESAIKELSKLNINCVTCHNYVRVAYPFTPDVQLEPKTIYGPKGDEATIENHKEAGFKSLKSEAIKKSEMCATCHHGCPPGIPSTICPTLYTGYMEYYVAKGGKETCQSCHMKGEDYKNHKFAGAYDREFLREGIELTLNARRTSNIDHLRNKMLPTVVIKVDVKNNTGHKIPYG